MVRKTHTFMILLALGCSGKSNAPLFDAPPPPPSPELCTPTPGTSIRLAEVARGFTRPLLVISPPGDPRLFVVEQVGRIVIIENGVRLPEPFLDIRERVVETGNEQGLLGLAFHPGFAQNGRFFVNYTARDPDGDTVVAEYRVSAADPARADPASERRLFSGGPLAQPATNHNGGMLAFGPDGYLYIATGDGGRADDIFGHGQNLDTLLAAILRVDVDAGEPYAIPPSNPFVGKDGADELWAFGLRNPWRFSFDRATGDMYIGDVGQGTWEEINVQPATSTGGENYGWSVYEGTHCFAGPCDDPAPYTMPVHEYDHGGDRCSVTGGYVYRGQCLPDLQGMYFYADFCRGIWAFRYSDGAATDHRDLTGELDPDGRFYERFTSWGEDGYGELYAVSRDGLIYRVVAE